jgi:hypothetical protein
MTKTNSESGHAKNVTNFHTLIEVCISFGAAYSPLRRELTIPGLTSAHSTYFASVTDVNTWITNGKNTKVAREKTYQPFSTLITRVQAAARACGINGADYDNIAFLVRKLHGQRAVPKQPASTADPNAVPTVPPAAPPATPAATPPAPAPKNISVSQMSFDSRLSNLDLLIKLLNSLPAYAPAEPDLGVTSLSALYNLMMQQNEAVIKSEIATASSRITRNHVLYTPVTGMVAIARDVRSYVMSIFTINSPEYREVSALKIINLTPR